MPVLFHVPPRPEIALASDWTDPSPTSIRFSLPSAKKPTDRLSGDQNGSWAPSVPARGRTVTESIERSHNRGRPSESATKTTMFPTGEMARDVGSECGGVVRSTRISAGDAAD